MPYFNPHSFRKTLARLGGERCSNAEELKAWSQNLGHEDVMTTLRSYGKVAPAHQAEIIRKLAQPIIEEPDLGTIFCKMVEAEAAKLHRLAVDADPGPRSNTQSFEVTELDV